MFRCHKPTSSPIPFSSLSPPPSLLTPPAQIAMYLSSVISRTANRLHKTSLAPINHQRTYSNYPAATLPDSSTNKRIYSPPIPIPPPPLPASTPHFYTSQILFLLPAPAVQTRSR